MDVQDAIAYFTNQLTKNGDNLARATNRKGVTQEELDNLRDKTYYLATAIAALNIVDHWRLM